MLKKLAGTFSFLLLLGCHLSAQQYGFEWIKPSLSYYKFSTSATGMAKVKASTLAAAGMNISAVNPSNIQVFKNGVEQPVYVNGGEDGQFDPSDFIEIYIERNNGDLDSVLYAPGGQPHRYYSLFTDTSCYFITVDPSVSQPLRFTLQNDYNFGAYVAEDFFTDEVVIAPANEYLDGPNMAPGSELKYLTSDYEQGEGWAGSRVGQSGSVVYTAKTPAAYLLAGNATASIKVIGASDAARNANGKNHHFTVGVSNNNIAYTILVDHIFAGYDQPAFSVSVPINTIGSGVTYFNLKTLNDIGVVSDFNSLSYIKLNYPRQFNWAGTTFKRLVVQNAKGGAKTRLSISSFGTGAESNPVVWDFTNRARINAAYNAGLVSVLLNNDGKLHDIVVEDSTQLMEISQVESVNFKVFNANSGAEYLIITHPLLGTAAANYAQYRSGQLSVATEMVNELYDYFNYGIKHPLSIKRYLSYLLHTATVKPKYLLLAGKGYQNDKIRVAVPGNPNPNDYYNRNYVPCLGAPSADALYSSGILLNGAYPEIATGRIPAATNLELQHFLDKLIYLETTTDSLAEWKKGVIHVSGGNDEAEQNRFANQINKNRIVIEGEYTGSFVTTFNKNSSDAQQINLKQKIIDAQNEGASLFSFLGHASLTVLDVDIGSINDLTNVNKYPFYYFSGCNVGNVGEMDVNGSGNIYGKDYICAANKGAIGWLAHSNFTFDATLYRLMDAFYAKYTKSMYRSPIGDIMYQVGVEFNATDIITKSHIIQWQLQGDPFVSLRNPALPDYRISNSDILIAPKNLTVQEDSFEVNVIVTNLGKATPDTVTMAVKHLFPNGKVVLWPSQKYSRIFYKDTLSYWIKYDDMSALLGNNSFEVTIDREQNIAEGNEWNNVASISTFVAGSGVSALLPSKYELVDADSVVLIGQNNNVLIKDAEYLFELDTTPSFNSSAGIKSPAIKAGSIAQYKVSLPFGDTVAYYWRVRLNVDPNQGGQWNQSSFSVVRGGNKGIAQVRFDQIKDLESKQQVNLTEGAFSFASTYKGVKSIISRWSHGGLGVLDPYFNTPQAGSCISGGIVLVLFDANTLERTSQSGYPTNCNPNQGGTIYNYYAFDTRTVSGQNNMIQFLDSVKAGNYLAAYSYYHAGADLWTPTFRTALSNLGLSAVSSVQSQFNAFTFIVKKGYPTESVEDTIFDDRGSFIPGVSPYTVSEKEIEGKLPMGSVLTTKLGPALSWSQCSLVFDSIQSSDSYKVSIKGVSQSNVDTLLLSLSNTHTINLSSIDAGKYPYLRVEVEMTDSVLRSPIQLRRMILNYQPSAELSFDPSIRYSFYKNTIDQGDSLRLTIAIRNLSTVQSDSCDVVLQIVDANRLVKYQLTEKVPPLALNNSYVFSRPVSTHAFSGINDVKLSVNDQKTIPERSFINNYFSEQIDVKVDKKNPIMDITFDGYHIMNGDIVSPTPVIRVLSKDNNIYRLQTDTSTFALYLRAPSQNDYERISMNDKRVTFYPASNQNNKASVEYKPDPLADGLYKMKVISKDASGNASGNNAYEVDFTVINESSITNFFPYPNPFTTNMRFVFTVTGANPPEDLLIRIMTITGKVVREITKEEFGPIKIGNNVSEFVWDGTDNYGDRLANGVYLYQVLTRLNGESIKKRSTDADKYVTNSVGKIYMLR